MLITEVTRSKNLPINENAIADSAAAAWATIAAQHQEATGVPPTAADLDDFITDRWGAGQKTASTTIDKTLLPDPVDMSPASVLQYLNKANYFLITRKLFKEPPAPAPTASVGIGKYPNPKVVGATVEVSGETYTYDILTKIWKNSDGETISVEGNQQLNKQYYLTNSGYAAMTVPQIQTYVTTASAADVNKILAYLTAAGITI